jgi:hypothetical protein
MQITSLKSIGVDNQVFESICEYCDAFSSSEAFVPSSVFASNLKLLKGKVNVSHIIVSAINDAHKSDSIIRFYIADRKSFNNDQATYNCYETPIPAKEFAAILTMCDGEGYNELFIRYYKLLNYIELMGLADNEIVKSIISEIKKKNVVKNGDYLKFKKA